MYLVQCLFEQLTIIRVDEVEDFAISDRRTLGNARYPVRLGCRGHYRIRTKKRLPTADLTDLLAMLKKLLALAQLPLTPAAITRIAPNGPRPNHFTRSAEDWGDLDLDLDETTVGSATSASDHQTLFS